jgi:hypothetical protein
LNMTKNCSNQVFVNVGMENSTTDTFHVSKATSIVVGYASAPGVVSLVTAEVHSEQPSPLVVSEEESAAQQVQWQRIHDALNGTTQIPATCTKDMRSKMPACHQFGSMWCWATGVSELTEYYKGSGPAQCKGLECQIVGWCPKPPHCSSTPSVQCCPLSSHESCGSDGASLQMVVEAANHFTGRTHQLTNGPMSQATLDKTLASGSPIMMLVGKTTPYHVVTVAGCGQGSYYFHDPEWDAGRYELYSYDKLLQSSYKWLDTVAAVGSSPNVVV